MVQNLLQSLLLSLPQPCLDMGTMLLGSQAGRNQAAQREHLTPHPQEQHGEVWGLLAALPLRHSPGGCSVTSNACQ